MAYVYRHIRLDKNQPFYIGIGTDNFYRRARSIHGRNLIWKGIVSRTEYDVEILIDDVTIDISKEKEIEFINLYRRICDGGILANLSLGGEGGFGIKGILSKNFGKKRSDEVKKKMGLWQKGKSKTPHTEETKKKMSQIMKGIKIPQSRIDKSVATRKLNGKKMSDAQKALISKNNLGNKYCSGRVMGQQTKDKISRANSGRIAYNKGKAGLAGKLNGMFGKKHTEASIAKNKASQNKRPVCKCDLNGKVLCTYNSLSLAAKENNVFVSGVQANCKGRVKSYKKLIWKYV